MAHSRRSFLKAAPALAAVMPARVETSPRDGSFDPWVEVNTAHLRHNVAEIRRRVAPRPILAVIKNNGYGLGGVNVARALERAPGIAGFAVVKLQEAVTVREAGIRAPLLLMGPCDERDLADAAGRDVMPMVYSTPGATLERVATNRSRALTVHVCVDTGLGRVGVPTREADRYVREIAARKGVRIGGVMMTFSEDPDLDREQIARFASLTDEWSRVGVAIGMRHAASSFTLFQRPEAFFDMVRPGMAVMGVYSEQAFRTSSALALKPAVALRTRVAYVKQLRAGESAGYNRAYVAKEDVWVATLPVGHADGWPRAAAKGARVRIGEALYPVIASVSASHTILEIGRERRVEIGDIATLFDWQDGSRPEDVAAACGASVYDLTMHLNPLLPRVLV